MFLCLTIQEQVAVTMASSFRFPRTNRLRPFKNATGISDWTDLKILDYGGNAGNVLRDGLEIGEIVQSDYTCLDVDKLVLEEAKKELPNANWIHYNRKNECYNPEGETRIPFPFEDNTFDIVCAYSVHTHTSYEDLVFDLSEMKRVGKVVVTSLIDLDFLKVVKMKREFDYGDKLHPLWHNPLPLDGYRYYVDGEHAGDTIPDSCDFLITLYDLEWLKKQHPEIRISPSDNTFDQPMLVIDE